MQFEIISIGDEVLQGRIVNTNASFLSSELSELGWSVSRQTTLPDDFIELKKGMEEALTRSSCVICTGGLGPTCDDITRRVAAELFDSPLRQDPIVAEELKRRYGEKLSSLADQSSIPAKAKALINPHGTAPGILFHEAGKILILLPGVPIEMKAIFKEHVIPFLKNNIPITNPIFQKKLHFSVLSENLVDPILREIKIKFPEIMGVGIYPGYGTLTVILSSEKQEILTVASQMLADAFPTQIFPSASGKIEEALYAELIKRKKTLAFAESITGGKMASMITAIPGASDYFLGSFVVYSNSMKEKVLSVKHSTLKNGGAVSAETAKEMLEGLFQMSNADYGIAITGIAGPSGGTSEKPVGTVWIAIGEKGKAIDIAYWQLYKHGSRETNILVSANRALSALWRKIAHGERLST